MKKSNLLFIFAILLFQVVNAGPTAPVTHSHNDRVHTHPLPIQGISHQHGNGKFGVAMTITSSVKKNTDVKKADIDTKTKVINIETVEDEKNQDSITSEVETPFEHDVIKSNIENDVAIQTPMTENIDFTKGDANCRLGEADCNVCATNVQKQFQRAIDGKIRWQSQPWAFNWPNRYPPYGIRPLDVFDGQAVYALGIPDKHIQGFVRTNSNFYPYAGSHSHQHRGSVFVLKATKNGKVLSSIEQTKGRHPSAVHTLGKYLVYGDGNNLSFLNIDNNTRKNLLSLSIKKAGFGGGLGLARLSNGHALLITTTPGGQKSAKRKHRFYHLKTREERPVALDYINQSDSLIPSGWPKVYSYSENLSVVTECGTGSIYTIHTSGDERGVSMIRGSGYWRLSRLEMQQGELLLQPISAFSSRQNIKSCNLRAAATVFANEYHKLEFYCHAYAKDPDGSMFNVLGSSSRNADKFYFKIGTL